MEEELKDIEVDAKLCRKGGYWFVTFEGGSIDLDELDQEEALNLMLS